MKKLFSFTIVFVITILSTVFVVAGANPDSIYSESSTQQIYDNYTVQADLLNAVLCSEKGIAYWNLTSQLSDNKFISDCIDNASRLIGAYPDKKDYAETLSNLITMQTGDLAEQIENQSQFDNLETGVDYAFKLVDIAFSFAGDNINAIKDISPIIDAVSGGQDIIIDDIELAKYYEVSVKDYSKANNFLTSINIYSANQELKDVAGNLIEANKNLLLKRLEYFSSVMENNIGYEAEFFVKNLSFDLLKNTDIYNSDETVRWFIDGAGSIAKTISGLISAGEFAFRGVMLAGDIGFGTTNTFKRYQEMKTVADISTALSKASEKIKVSSNGRPETALGDIQKKCDIYKMLIVTHARGEYLIYQLVTSDAGILSDINCLFDMCKNPDETKEAWYKKQIDTLTEYTAIIDNIFHITAYTSDDAKSAYQSIINEYQNAILNGGTNADYDDYPHVNTLALHLLGNGKIQYAYHDIDGNDIPELLFRLYYDYEDNIHPMDVYTFDGTNACKLFNDDTLAERSSLTLYDDGTMYIYGSGGANYGIASFYSIDDDGYSQKLQKEYTVDFEKYPETPFYNENEHLSQDEFERVLGSYKKLEVYDWQDVTVQNQSTGNDKIPLELDEVESRAAEIEQMIRTGFLNQTELNIYSAELYEIWDDKLNDLWSQLKSNLSSQSMEVLRQEQVEWVNNKEKEVDAAGDEAKGGTMEPMLRNAKAAELTKERVYQLLSYLHN